MNLIEKERLEERLKQITVALSRLKIILFRSVNKLKGGMNRKIVFY